MTAIWTQKANTSLQDAGYDGSVSGGIYAWSSGAYDTSRDRFMIYGGGHMDYGGNEIYGILPFAATPSITVVNAGSPTWTETVHQYADGKPSARHTYDGLVYVPSPHGDVMWQSGGYVYGDPTIATTWLWVYDIASDTWTRKTPTGWNPNGDNDCWAACYDPNTGGVVLWDRDYVGVYDCVANTWSIEGTGSTGGYHHTSIIDTDNRYFWAIGGGICMRADIGASGNYTMATVSTSGTGGSTVIAVDSPGLAYDPVDHVIVANVGTRSVYRLNPATLAWSTETPSTGPSGGVGSGIFKRFAYAPLQQQFVLELANSGTDVWVLDVGHAAPPIGTITLSVR